MKSFKFVSCRAARRRKALVVSIAAALAGAVASAQSPLPTPGIFTSDPTEVSYEGARLNGSFNPNSSASNAAARVWFEWGGDTNYGNLTPVQIVPAAYNGLSVTSVLNNLSFNTAYHYRLVGTNGAGIFFGNDVGFTTSHIILLSQYPVIGATGPTTARTLASTFFPAAFSNDVPTVWGEYGLTTNYGNMTPSMVSQLPNSAGYFGGWLEITNLLPGGTQYHARLVASNSLEIVLGPDMPFLSALGFAETIDVPRGIPGSFMSQSFSLGCGAWGDFDNDGLLDILIAGYSPNYGSNICQIWRNTGHGFTNIETGLTGIVNGSVAWGDYDNDGRLDILIAGHTGRPWADDTPTNYVCQVWRNTGNGFSNIFAGLPGLGTVNDGRGRSCKVAWGDYDNDGRIDILLSGSSKKSGHPITEIWRNTGSGFTTIQAGLPGVEDGDAAWGDFDNDGWMDLVTAGSLSGFQGSCDIWRNTGSGFTNMNAELTQIAIGGAVKCGDFNGDGRLDILLSGTTFERRINELWVNTGGAFVLTNVGLPVHQSLSPAWGDFDNDGLSDIVIPDIGECQGWKNAGSNFARMTSTLPVYENYQAWAAWGDYDNDGRLDLLAFSYMYPVLCCGAQGSRSPVWHNILPTTNTPPTAPSDLTAVPGTDSVTLTWSAASDAQTPSTGLAYNLRVGSKPGGADIVNPQADLVSGRKRVPDLGNCQYSRTKTVTHLAPGIYYWSVQAVDTGYAGGPFAAEGVFSIGGVTRIVNAVPATNDVFHLEILGAPATPYEVISTTNPALPAAEWASLGTATESSPGHYEFNDPGMMTSLRRFYQVRTTPE